MLSANMSTIAPVFAGLRRTPLSPLVNGFIWFSVLVDSATIAKNSEALLVYS